MMTSGQRNRSDARTRSQDRDQRLVTTPYGRGLVLRTHPQSGMQDIQMLDWDTTSTSSCRQQQQSPMLHSPLLYKSVTPMLGDDVLTVYGRGRIIGLQPQVHNVIVELTSWRLAQRSTVKCYLDVHQVQVVRKKTLHKMNAWERVQHAHEWKRQATDFFGRKNYEQALACYSKAVDAVRNVQHDAQSSNEVRADLVLVMITCCNNAATCCIQLSRYDLAVNFAKNALVLIDALYEKRGMKVHSILVRDGTSDEKMFGEYRVKALLMIARGLSERGECDSAIVSLKQAKDAIAMYYNADSDSDSSGRSHLFSQQKQVKRLHATCVERKKALKQKEKQRAQAMFATSPSSKNTPVKKENDKPDNANPIVTPSPKPTNTAIETDEELEELASETSSPTTKRSVSFADDTKPGSREFLEEQDHDDDDVEEETPWFGEHKEALVLSAIAGLAALSVVLLRSHRK